MNIKFQPADKKHPADRKAFTMIGEFMPGEVRTITEEQEPEAQRLIENGDFVETEEDPNADDVYASAPEAAEKQAAKAEREAAKAPAARASDLGDANADGTLRPPVRARATSKPSATSKRSKK